MVSWIQRTPAGTRGWRRFDANGTMAYAGHIREPLTFNRYSDVMGGPLNYVDPSGHGIWDWIKDFFVIGEDKEETKPVKETESPTASVPKSTEKNTETKRKMDEAKKNTKAETCLSLEVPISMELMEELHWEPMDDKELN